MHKNWHVRLKNAVALKVLVWSRGRLATLQILTRSSFSLVEETHGPSGQCVILFLNCLLTFLAVISPATRLVVDPRLEFVAVLQLIVL